ncbi:MAG: glycosyltransferase [Acidobacteriota bacterium]|nr:glycosyltransferase [Acidobacteriota bacterium]
MRPFKMTKDGSDERGLRDSLFAYALIFTCLFITHAPLLRLPYFWDEAGYFIPAARDLLLTGSLVPHTTLSNAHPPLVMVWLAFWWKFSALTPAVTRTSMLLVAAFALLGLWRLSRYVAGEHVALATVLCTAFYPVFFAQSSLAHLDMMASAFTLWGLAMYVERRPVATVVFFSLAPLAKETAVISPLALFAWELVCPWLTTRRSLPEPLCLYRGSRWQTISLLLCLLPLALWFLYHHHRTGFYLGNPEYLRYNLQATANPLRVVLAMLLRLWQVLGYLNLFLLTLAALVVMRRPPLREADGTVRPRIAITVQLVFAVVILGYVVALSIAGGAVLARYMLPVVPLVILICVSTLRRRARQWAWWIALTCAAFLAQLVIPPPYRIAPEDTLLYRDYVVLHKMAADELAKRYPDARVLTAWPASDELTRPFLGYVKQPLTVVRLENFSPLEMEHAAQATDQFDVALLFTTKWKPPHPILQGLPFGKALQERFFDYHEDMDPRRAAELLGGRVVRHFNRNNEWVAIIAVERIQNAAVHDLSPPMTWPRNAHAPPVD